MFDWEDDTANTWRIEDCVLAAGSLEKRLVKNAFLATTKEFMDIEPTLKWKAEGKHVNGGVQFRSMRGADSQEVSGCHLDCVAAGAPNSAGAGDRHFHPVYHVMEAARKGLHGP